MLALLIPAVYNLTYIGMGIYGICKQEQDNESVADERTVLLPK
jgi:hypothetical protein